MHQTTYISCFTNVDKMMSAYKVIICESLGFRLFMNVNRQANTNLKVSKKVLLGEIKFLPFKMFPLLK